jgi:hypothetical protein
MLLMGCENGKLCVTLCYLFLGCGQTTRLYMRGLDFLDATSRTTFLIHHATGEGESLALHACSSDSPEDSGDLSVLRFHSCQNS